MSDLLTLPNTVAALIVLALNAYLLMGGADFGGGVWDLFATGPRRDDQRSLIAHAIGPIWEANHVWLILVVVLLFTCFPPAFAVIGTVLHIPLTLMLIGIVLRGSAFTFRTYGSRRDTVQRRRGRIFSVASVVTPLLLGTCVGAIAAGRATAPPGAGAYEIFVATWLTPFALGVGVFTLVLCAFLAAVYLTLEAGDDALREDFRRRALLSALVLFPVAYGVLILSASAAPRMLVGLTTMSRALPIHLLTALAAVTAIWALWRRRYRLARIAAAAQVSLIVWGWAVAQFPYLLPPTITISDAAAPAVTLRLVLWALAGGAALLLPSLYYLFRVFKGAPAAFERMER